MKPCKITLQHGEIMKPCEITLQLRGDYETMQDYTATRKRL